MEPRLYVTFDLTPILEVRNSLSEIDTRKLTQEIINKLKMEVYNNWVALAKRELHSTRKNYVDSINISSTPNGARIWLAGNFNNMLEAGCEAFDMKEGFQNSPKVKISKAGNWYLRIPFRFSTPGALGEAAAFSAPLPKAVYSEIKKQTLQSKKKTFVLDTSKLRPELVMPGKRAAIKDKSGNVIHEEYRHKSSIYEGLAKVTKKYEAVTQSKYQTFRTVSALSDPKAFIHRGIQAYDFATKATQNIDVRTIVDNTIDRFLENR